MQTALFDELQSTLKTEGPSAAVDRLCTRLRELKDYESLFYARLMAKRYELGVTPVPTAPTSDVPEAKQPEFEEAIRTACHEVGGLFLREGNLPQAWNYYRMIGETGPVAKALADYQPREDEDVEPLIRLSLYEGLQPNKGFDLVLGRYGLCSAITTLGGHQLPLTTEARQYCIGRVVRALYTELRERLSNEIERHEGSPPPEITAPQEARGVVRSLIANRPWLFADEAYHVDMSHLHSAVQMAADLEPGEDLERARELCEYGQRLSRNYVNPGDPPFEDHYRDYGVLFAIHAGDRREEGLAHFRAKVERSKEEDLGSGPAEVYVQMLLRLNRPMEALEIAREYLAPADNPWLTYTADLCRKANNYDVLAQVAQQQGNPVQFLAGLLAQQ